jgi:hypothetical protein
MLKRNHFREPNSVKTKECGNLDTNASCIIPFICYVKTTDPSTATQYTAYRKTKNKCLDQKI